MSVLTVVILTKNEELNIEACVMNAKQVTDDILVIDSGSTDRTVELAEKCGARVVFRAWTNDFSEQRNFALEHVYTEWVLYLDADERMNEALVQEIKRIVQEDKKALYRLGRYNNAFGRSFRYGVLGPDSVVRLFPSKGVKWEGRVHESPQGNLAEVFVKKGYLEHYTYADWNEYLHKMNLYAEIGAKNNFARGKRTGIIKDLCLRPLLAFVKMYFLKGGIREGWLGFSLSVNYANYTFNKYAVLKLLEKQNG